MQHSRESWDSSHGVLGAHPCAWADGELPPESRGHSKRFPGVSVGFFSPPGHRAARRLHLRPLLPGIPGLVSLEVAFTLSRPSRRPPPQCLGSRITAQVEVVQERGQAKARHPQRQGELKA